MPTLTKARLIFFALGLWFSSSDLLANPICERVLNVLGDSADPLRVADVLTNPDFLKDFDDNRTLRLPKHMVSWDEYVRRVEAVAESDSERERLLRGKPNASANDYPLERLFWRAEARSMRRYYRQLFAAAGVSRILLSPEGKTTPDIILSLRLPKGERSVWKALSPGGREELVQLLAIAFWKGRYDRLAGTLSHFIWPPNGTGLVPIRFLRAVANGFPVGVCRHSTNAFVALLLELGASSQEIQIRWTDRHAFVAYRGSPERQWRYTDPTGAIRPDDKNRDGGSVAFTSILDQLSKKREYKPSRSNVEKRLEPLKETTPSLILDLSGCECVGDPSPDLQILLRKKQEKFKRQHERLLEYFRNNR